MYKLTYGTMHAPTDDGGEFPPHLHTRYFDTREEMEEYAGENVYPWYGAEEGFYIKREVTLTAIVNDLMEVI